MVFNGLEQKSLKKQWFYKGLGIYHGDYKWINLEVKAGLNLNM